MSFKRDRKHDKKKDKHIKVDVWQLSKARAGQGNAFAINASNVNIAKKKTIDVKKKINVKKINVKKNVKVIIIKKKRHF